MDYVMYVWGKQYIEMACGTFMFELTKPDSQFINYTVQLELKHWC